MYLALLFPLVPHSGSFSHHAFSHCPLYIPSRTKLCWRILSLFGGLGGGLAPMRHMRSCFRCMMTYHIGCFSHHAFSPCISAWPIPTHLLIHIINTNLSSCRLVDLSTCRSTAIDDNEDLVDLHLHLYLACRHVDTSINCFGQ